MDISLIGDGTPPAVVTLPLVITSVGTDPSGKIHPQHRSSLKEWMPWWSRMILVDDTKTEDWVATLFPDHLAHYRSLPYHSQRLNLLKYMHLST